MFDDRVYYAAQILKHSNCANDLWLTQDLRLTRLVEGGHRIFVNTESFAPFLLREKDIGVFFELLDALERIFGVQQFIDANTV